MDASSAYEAAKASGLRDDLLGPYGATVLALVVLVASWVLFVAAWRYYLKPQLDTLRERITEKEGRIAAAHEQSDKLVAAERERTEACHAQRLADRDELLAQVKSVLYKVDERHRRLCTWIAAFLQKKTDRPPDPGGDDPGATRFGA